MWREQKKGADVPSQCLLSAFCGGNFCGAVERPGFLNRSATSCWPPRDGATPENAMTGPGLAEQICENVASDLNALLQRKLGKRSRIALLMPIEG